MKVGLGAMVAGGGLAAYQWGEVDRLQVVKSRLPLPRWTADGMLLAQISDLHLNSRHAVDRALCAVSMAVAHKPDVLVITGDFVHGRDERVENRLEEFLRGIEDYKLPKLAILGNHDYWVPHVSKVIDLLEKSSVSLLRNDVQEIGGVRIFGIDDGIAGKDRHDALGINGDQNVVALFHEPDFVDRLDRRISLMLAGHSHGGQICLPGGWALHTPRGARKYIKGFYPDAVVPLYVSAGVGVIGIEARSFCRPEVTILELVRSEEGSDGSD